MAQEEETMEERWFSVKGLFRWYFKESGETSNYEERVVLIRAVDLDDALDKAEIEAKEYCTEDPEANFLIESLNKYSAHDILEEKLIHGTEVFSSRVETDSSPDEFIKKYYPNISI